MKVFLSYPSEHKGLAEKIELALTSNGINVFRDNKDIKPGASYDRKIRSEMRKAELFVFLVSHGSIEKGRWTLSELEMAQVKWPSPDGRVLPVMIEDVAIERIPNYLAAVRLLDVPGDIPSSVVTHVRELLATLDPPKKRSGLASRWRLGSAVGGVLLMALIVIGVMLLTELNNISDLNQQLVRDLQNQQNQLAQQYGEGNISVAEVASAQARIDGDKREIYADQPELAEALDRESASTQILLESGDPRITSATLQMRLGESPEDYVTLQRAVEATVIGDNAELHRAVGDLTFTLGADVSPNSPTAAFDRLMESAGRIELDVIGSDAAKIQINDLTAFFMRSEQTGRLVVFDYQPVNEGQLSLLFPQDGGDIDYVVAANTSLHLPDDVMADELLMAGPPAGPGTLFALVIPDEDFGAFYGENLAFSDLAESQFSIEYVLGMLASIDAITAEDGVSDWGYGRLNYEIIAADIGE